MSQYIATDDDLPDIFWPEGEAPVRQNSALSETVAEKVKLQLFYPEIRISASAQRRREAAIRSEREISLEDRKVYIKLGKKVQMWSWLRMLFEPGTIGQVRAENSDRVMEFLSRLYAKFYHYSPQKVKWITRKQYDWLENIASKYMKVPNEKKTSS
jgi:hypothetical protein